MNFGIGSDAAGWLYGVLDFFAALRGTSFSEQRPNEWTPRSILTRNDERRSADWIVIVIINFDLKYVTGARWGSGPLVQLISSGRRFTFCGRIQRIHWRAGDKQIRRWRLEEKRTQPPAH